MDLHDLNTTAASVKYVHKWKPAMVRHECQETRLSHHRVMVDVGEQTRRFRTYSSPNLALPRYHQSLPQSIWLS